MLAEDRATPSTVLLWGLARDAGRGMSGRPIAAPRAERQSRAPELAPTLTRDVVRRVAAGAIGVNIALSLIDVWRVAYYPSPRPPVGAAALAALVTIPLHIRHVLYGLRGERPPAGIWTLAALAIVNAIATAVVGSAWIFQYASFAVSILIVVPGALGTALAVAVLVSPLLLVGTQWYGGGLVYPGFYLTFAMTWRAATQFVPLRLLAAIRALDTAGRELEARAVVQTRVRIDGELRTGVAGALRQIVARGEVARAAAERDRLRRFTSSCRIVGRWCSPD